jgi:eukaryotic translation initiation factor 2-alpha kinase 3
MFRSPTDASSSESDSDSVSDEEIEVSRISTNKSVTQDSTPSSSQHVNLIAASLLEFHATVQAAEILNVSNAGQGTRYDRHSPEAKALAKKLFANRSQLLASHGMLAGDIPHNQDTRQQYLTGIASLGIPEALRDAGALPATPRLALEAAGAPNFTLGDVSQRGDLLPNIKQLAIPSLPRLPDVSRYATEFTEIKQLGRGGFGTVYHVVNFVDKQPYAIKKISLDPRRLKRRWQEGGREEVENVLREIRTLASLEHTNIVRYFGAWIEGPQGSSPEVTQLEGSRPPLFRQLLGEKSAESALFQVNGPHSQSGTNIPWGAPPGVAQLESAESVSIGDGIVFGEDSTAEQPVKVIAEVEATTSTISLSNETDIFTDGDGRSGRSMSDHNADEITLCLQMSLHQLNLANYLSPQRSTLPSPDPLHDPIQSRHCFHLKPSLSIFLGILSGVQYLHAAGIVHRDLKPANIFLSDDSTLHPGFVDASCFACPQKYSRYLNARIGDFGLVGNIAEELSASASAPDKVVGTELYRPPSGKGKGLAVTTAVTRIDEKIDVFALGVLLFELLWRFDTKTERFVVLNALTRTATLPAGFRDMFANTTEGNLPPAADKDVWGPPGTDGADLEQRQQRSAPGDLIAECIAGMVDSDPAGRWDCATVKECIERVLQMCY